VIELRFDELAQITNGSLVNVSHSERAFRGVSIDSRTIKMGELFVAIQGDSFDGHDFITAAKARGAGGALTGHVSLNDENELAEFPTVVVDNSHKAMIELAPIRNFDNRRPLYHYSLNRT